MVDIKKIHADMQRALEEDTKRISEQVFKDVFLPMFHGTGENTHEMVLMKWAQFAGSLFHPVYIVDAAGKILFKVPPVVNRDAVGELAEQDANGTPMQSVSHMLSTYNQLVNANLPAAERYMNEQLGRRLGTMQGKANYIQDLENWNAIFTHFGVAPIKEIAGIKDQTKTGGNYSEEIESL